MSWGTMGVDWETRVDYDRLRNYRLGRAKEQLVKHKIGAYLCFDFNNIRYLTGVHIGEWARDKMHRYAVLPAVGSRYYSSPALQALPADSMHPGSRIAFARL